MLVFNLMPDIGSMGHWGYWAIGAMAFFEALVLTSVFSPGTVAVVLGGALAAQGIYHIGTMMWFVGVGTVLGSQASFWLGTRSTKLLADRPSILSPANLARGRRFFEKYGAASIVIGHFLGPVRPIAPVVAGLSGMDRRRFLVWNVAGGAAYAVSMVGVGYFFGTTLSLFGASSTRLGLLIAAVLAAVALLWFAIVQIRRSIPYMLSTLGSWARRLRDRPEIRALVTRHPRLFDFLAARVSREAFSGLPATLLGLTFLYFLGLYAETALEFLDHGSFVQADNQISHLVYTLRSDGPARFFTIITGLGHWRAVVISALTASILMWVWHRRSYILALWVTLIGNVATVGLLKQIFSRTRPEFAVYVEGTYSFPSGHSATIAALWIFLTYVLVRERIGSDLLWILSCFTLVLLVGVSRLYLGEHFLSDVLNGYIVGVLWAITGIFVAERLNLRRRAPDPRPTGAGRRWATVGILAVAFAGLAVVVQDYSVTLQRALPSPAAQITMPVAQAMQQGELPARTESLLGTPQEAVSMILYAADDAALTEAMTAAGWQLADPPGVVRIAQAALAALLGKPDATRPITLLFWNGWTQDFGFEQAGASGAARPQARFWNTQARDADGRQAYVGTVRTARGLLQELTPHPVPDPDAQRDRLVAELRRGGAFHLQDWVQIVDPVQGQSEEDDPPPTDGRAAILTAGVPTAPE